MVSMKDISMACGVSVATVSKALNDHKDIGEETKAQIRRVAKELGYSPNAAAKSLKTNRTYNLGVLFADEAMSGLTHDYFLMCWTALRIRWRKMDMISHLSTAVKSVPEECPIWSTADTGGLTAW